MNPIPTLRFLFPAHPIRPRLPDEMFADQVAAFRAAGFPVSLVVTDDSTGSVARVVPAPEAGETAVYRGWMLNEAEYRKLCGFVAGVGAVPLTDAESYLACHHLPNWYPLIEDLTPQTRIFSEADDLERAMKSLNWDTFFVKDYVKSLKTSRGSIVRSASEIRGLLDEMREARGVIEGGVCLRQVEAFLPETESRYFVLNGEIFSPTQAEIPECVRQCANRIHRAFFSVDAIQRQDGVWRVVEIGDGQVSDLVGWEVAPFVAMWTPHPT